MKDFFKLREELQLREATSRWDHYDNVAKIHDEKAKEHEKIASDRRPANNTVKQSQSHQTNTDAYHAHRTAARLARSAADAHYNNPNTAADATDAYNKAAAKAKQHSSTAREAEAEESRNKDK